MACTLDTKTGERTFVVVVKNAVQFVALVSNDVTAFLDGSLADLHPTAIAGMVVNGRLATGIPAHEQEGVVLMVGSHQVSCVSFGNVPVCILSHFVSSQAYVSAAHARDGFV